MHLGRTSSEDGAGMHHSETEKSAAARAAPPKRAQPRTSFRRKITQATLLTTVAALAAASMVFMARQWRAEREEMVQSRTAFAQMTASMASDPVLFKDWARTSSVLLHAADLQGVTAVQVFDADGRLFARVGAEVPAAAGGTPLTSWRFHHDALEVHAPVLLDQERVGELVLFSDLKALHRTFIGYGLFAFLLFVTVGAAAAAAAWSLAGRVIAPVGRLKSAMSQVRLSGDFSVTVEPAADIELAGLAHEFNSLLAELSGRDRDLQSAMGDLRQARDQAETASRLKTEFLANMSHEIRTPLNGVIGVAHLMAFDQLTPAQAERLGIIQRSGEELLDLLNNVLDVAKIEAGRLEVEQVEFDLQAAIAQACEGSAALAAEKGLRFEVLTSPALAGGWTGDPTRLRQILRNLAANAVKFTRSGEVRVEAGLDGSGAGGVILTVADTGVGIAPEQLPHIFGKFVQADASTTRTFGGSGLGLAICHELITLLGGTVSVRSRPGEGSRFEVRLPLVQAAEAAERRAA